MILAYSPIAHHPIASGGTDWLPTPAPAISGNRGITYRCTIMDTGYLDYVVPISNFTMRLRQSPKQCYLSVTIPGVLSHIDAINARIDGEIKIEQCQSGVCVTLLTANISEFRYDQGATNRSGGITAYKQKTHSSSTVTVPHASYKRSSGGVTSYRAPPVNNLKPTCVADVSSQQLTVDNVIWSINESRREMEFSDG